MAQIHAKQKVSKRLGESSPQIRRLCLSVDQDTAAIIKELQQHKGSDRIQTVREIIASLARGDIKTKEIADFYRDVWQRIVSRSEQNLLARYSWSEEADTALHLLASEILGTQNRSEMFRILVAFVGVRSGIVRINWTKAATLELPRRK